MFCTLQPFIYGIILKKLTQFSDYHYSIITLVYIASWFLITLNFGSLYWDDWTLYGQDSRAVIKTFSEAGAMFTGRVHLTLLGVGDSIWPYRLLTFSSYLIVSYSIYWLALQLSFLSKSSALFLALIVAVYPLNHARIALINTPSAYSLMLFQIGFVLCVVASVRKSYLVRISSLALLFISFETMSLLVFYFLPISYLLYFERDRFIKSPAPVISFTRWLTTKIDYLLLPFIFLGIKTIAFKPAGMYENYNSVGMDGVIAALGNTIPVITTVFVPLIDEVSEYYIVAMVLVITPFLFTKPSQILVSFKLSNVIFVLLGVLVLYLSIFPYVVVGKIPYFYDWSGRFYLLAPIGAAMLLCAAFEFFNKRIRVALISAVILFSTIINNQVMYAYLLDGFKQDSIVSNFRKLPELKNKMGVLLYKDNIFELNALSRTYRFYEFNGLMKKSLGTELLLGLYEHRPRNLQVLGEVSGHKPYSFSGYEPETAEVIGIIVIDPGGFKISPLQVHSILFDKLLSPSSYDKTISELTTLHFLAK